MSEPKHKLSDRVMELEGRITALEMAVGQLIEVRARSVIPPATQVFRSGRWHLRDGTAYGKPPLYADNQTRHLRSPDQRLD